jgi:ADP-ribose pyrophosphatase
MPPRTLNRWKTLSSKLAFDHRWFKVQQDTVELPNGTVLDDYFMWPEGDVVIIVPVTTDNQIILVKQYKHAGGDVYIEFPAGYLDKDETPEQAVRRELLEETGYDYKKITKLFESSSNPTKIIGKYHFFLVEECFVPSENSHKADETESIEVVVKTIPEVYDMIVKNEIKATAAIAAGFMALQKLQFIEKK